MKKSILFFMILSVPTVFLLAQPYEFCDPVPCFDEVITTVIGIVEVDGYPASQFDWISAYDQDGNVAGADQLILYGGQTYFNLQVLGDNLATPDIDEGINEGETFTFKLWVAASGEFLHHPMDIPPVEGWAVGIGNIPGWDSLDGVLNFSSTNTFCTKTYNLNAGWNLISFDVSPADKNIISVFGDLLGNLEWVASSDKGNISFNPPPGPPFLNTLKQLKDGFGYWVKVQNSDILSLEGLCLADDFRKPLAAGWNLIAYPPDSPQSPETYFADLIAAGNLEFVTGNDNGIKFFDPNGPPFLNTLQQLENGRGYWVKVKNATE